MKYWLMRSAIHGDEIQQIYVGRPWPYQKIYQNDRLKAGDIAYLSKGHGEIYSWGYVSKIEPYRDVDLEKELLRVHVIRPVLRDEIVPAQTLRLSAQLARLFANTHDNVIELSTDEVKTLNQLLRSAGVEAPPDPSEEDATVFVVPQSRRPSLDRTFVLNQPVKVEETRYAEFKEVFARNPVDAIKNAADEYAVALLNKEGGSMFWGIRNSNRVVVGISLNYQQRDEIRREVSNKIAKIQPHFPVSLFNLDFYPVRDEQDQDIEELWIFEMDIPGGAPTDLYATESGVVFVKTDGGKQKLSYLQLVSEIERRKGLQRVGAHDPDEDKMFAIVTELTRRARENVNCWSPPLGSDEHKLAEKMVGRNLLVQIMPGRYVLPGLINPTGFGGRRF
jgi:Putative DNA-binding domain